jgi:dTDP-4-dehydrorhamnose reductase
VAAVEGERVIVIIGAGYVGQALKTYFGERAVFLEGEHHSLTAFRTALEPLHPKVVINCAILGTPNSIEKLEEGTEEWKAHYTVNVRLPEWLGELAQELDYQLVHLSTLMFLDWGVESGPDGLPRLLFNNDGFDEDNGTPSGELSKYARMKWDAEQKLTGNKRALITRLHLPFSGVPNPRNLLTRMQHFTSFVEDQSSMTDLDAFPALVEKLIAAGVSGPVNCVNPGVISFYEIAEMMQEHGLIPKDQILEKSNLTQLNETRAPGTAYQPRVVAHSRRLAELGIVQPPIQEVLRDAVARLAAV